MANHLFCLGLFFTFLLDSACLCFVYFLLIFFPLSKKEHASTLSSAAWELRELIRTAAFSSSASFLTVFSRLVSIFLVLVFSALPSIERVLTGCSYTAWDLLHLIRVPVFFSFISSLAVYPGWCLFVFFTAYLFAISSLQLCAPFR